MHLIVDAFSHAPRVQLGQQGFMGLGVTGHKPGEDNLVQSKEPADEEALPEGDL
jgi:hypothetical protein